MKSLVYTILFFLTIAQAGFSQSPDTIWTKIFATDGDDYGEYVEQTNDGGFIIVGSTNVTGSDDIWLIKTNANGDTIWTKTFGTYLWDYATCVHQTSGGDFIIFGDTDSFYPDNWNGWLIKTNSSGDTLWTKIYTGSKYYFIRSGLELPGNGYVFVGYTKATAGGPEDIWLVRTDENGDTVWTKTFGGSNREMAFSLLHESNGDLVIAGNTESFGSGDLDVWIIKVNTDGDTIWTKTYGGTERDVAYDIKPTYDGGFIIAGHTDSFGHMNNYSDAWLIKIDSDGDTVWTKTWGTEKHDGAMSVVQTSDGGFVWTGNLYIDTFTENLWILKTDSDGNTLWSKSYGETFSNVGSCINKNNDGSLIITGSYYNEITNTRDIWLLNIDSDISDANQEVQIQTPKSFILKQNYPNPFNPTTTIKYSVPIVWTGHVPTVQLRIYDILGNEISTLVNEEKPAGNYTVKFDGSNLSSGVYFYQLKAGDFINTKKFLLLK